MAPKKKGEKMSLNAFLVDDSLGSWADEMDTLPSVSSKADDTRLGGRASEGFGGRSDRPGFPSREDLPLPNGPPYTAFVGNLAFDLAEPELEEFFSPYKMKSVKIIKDRDDRPKGFGYIEFEDLEGLKGGLEKSGGSMAGRTIRVSVAEPPKERSGFGGSGGGGGFDEPGPWRRDGPLPDLPGRDGSRRRFDGPPGERPPPPSGVADGIDQWRSSRPSPRIPPAELSGGPREGGFERRGPPPPREPGPADTADSWSKGSRFKPSEESAEGAPRRGGFGAGPRSPAEATAADTEETWSKGSRFKASEPSAEGGGRFGANRAGGRGDMGPPRDPPPHSVADDGVWRRPRAADSTSPTGSTPSTPQFTRRKLELLPKSGGPSAGPSPLSSPKIGPTNPSGSSTPRSNPFGDAKPIDSATKEKVIAERLEKERETAKAASPPQHSMSRSDSRPGMERTSSRPGMSRTSSKPSSPRVGLGPAANVRPAVSFASALGHKKESEGAEETDKQSPEVTKMADVLQETTI